MSAMIDVYYNLVKAGRRDLDKVPEEFRTQVKEKLDSDSK